MKSAHLAAALAIAICATAAIAREARVDPATAGKQVYERQCLACHGPGPGYPPFPEKPGTGALRVKYNGDVPALLTDRRDLTPEVVAFFVRNGVSVMPAYRKTEISDAELAQLGAYLARDERRGRSRR